MRGGSNYLRVRHRRGMRPARYQTGKVRHVHQVNRANLVGDLAHAGEINVPRIGAAATDNELWPLAFGDAFQIVIVDGLCFLGYTIGNDLVRFAGEVQRMAVGKMSSVREVQAEDR